MNETHDCRICAAEVKHSARYPNQVCERCAGKASDAYGRRLRFSDENPAGRFAAFYRDNGAPYDHRICYIDGVKCFAGEDGRGGLVVEVVADSS